MPELRCELLPDLARRVNKVGKAYSALYFTLEKARMMLEAHPPSSVKGGLGPLQPGPGAGGGSGGNAGGGGVGGRPQRFVPRVLHVSEE